MMNCPMRLMATPARQSNSPSPFPYVPNSFKYVPFASNTWTRWFDESATTMRLSGPTEMPRGQVNFPDSLPLPPICRICLLFWRYCVRGVLNLVFVSSVAACACAWVGEARELCKFFESSSELCISFAWRNGKPKLSRLLADDDADVDDGDEAAAVELL